MNKAKLHLKIIAVQIKFEKLTQLSIMKKKSFSKDVFCYKKHTYRYKNPFRDKLCIWFYSNNANFKFERLLLSFLVFVVKNCVLNYVKSFDVKPIFFRLFS